VFVSPCSSAGAQRRRLAWVRSAPSQARRDPVTGVVAAPLRPAADLPVGSTAVGRAPLGRTTRRAVLAAEAVSRGGRVRPVFQAGPPPSPSHRCPGKAGGRPARSMRELGVVAARPVCGSAPAAAAVLNVVSRSGSRLPSSMIHLDPWFGLLERGFRFARSVRTIRRSSTHRRPPRQRFAPGTRRELIRRPGPALRTTPHGKADHI